MSYWTGGSRLLDAAPGERQHVGSLVLVRRPRAPSPYFNRLHSHVSITSHIGKQTTCLNKRKKKNSICDIRPSCTWYWIDTNIASFVYLK